MAWESRRRGGRYYTRTRRVDGRFVREYVGGGIAGELAATLDAMEREHRAESQRQRKAESEALRALDGMLAGLHDTCDVVTKGTLASAGYYQHDHGEWRRRGKRGTD